MFALWVIGVDRRTRSAFHPLRTFVRYSFFAVDFHHLLFARTTRNQNMRTDKGPLRNAAISDQNGAIIAD